MSKSSPQPPTIVFDLGGVYFSDGTKHAIKTLSTQYGVDASALSEVLNGEIGSRWRTGNLDAHGFWSEARQRLDLPLTDEGLSLLWFEGYVPIPGTKSVVMGLRQAGYEVLYLSDNVPERVAFLEHRYQFLQHFTTGLFSFEAGCRKPDPRLYQRALALASNPPPDCIYIDDIERFLAPAAQLGAVTIHFRSPEQLLESLSAHGVATDQF